MLDHAILMLTLGFLLLVWSSDRFIVGVARVATLLGLSRMVVGIVFVGFATAFPELLVSLFASLDGHPKLALGNALGSYITNIGLVLGVSALVKPLKIHMRFLWQELPIMTLSLFLGLGLLALGGDLTESDGFILLLGFLAYTIYLVMAARSESQDLKKDIIKSDVLHHEEMSLVMASFWLVLGLGLMLLSVTWITENAVLIAKYFGINDLVIGLTIVAIGTSLPELAASVASALRGEHEIAVGNVIGSNIIGMLAVLAMPGIFAPSQIPIHILWREGGVMILLTFMLWIFVGRDEQHITISRPLAATLVLIFSGYLLFLVWSNT
jgi:cation:H+ antiporter